MISTPVRKNTEVAQQAVQFLLENLPDERNCTCSDALKDAIITQRDRIPPETHQKLGLLVDKYLLS